LWTAEITHAVKVLNTPSTIESSSPTDKAVLYVLSPTYKAYFQQKVSIGREWIGIVKAHTYFVVTINPGVNDICVRSGNNAEHLVLNAQTGKKYFIKLTVLEAFLGKPPSLIAEISEEDAAVWLKKTNELYSGRKANLNL
jgi:hypothetical protein